MLPWWSRPFRGNARREDGSTSEEDDSDVDGTAHPDDNTGADDSSVDSSDVSIVGKPAAKDSLGLAFIPGDVSQLSVSNIQPAHHTSSGITGPSVSPYYWTPLSPPTRRATVPYIPVKLPYHWPPTTPYIRHSFNASQPTPRAASANTSGDSTPEHTISRPVGPQYLSGDNVYSPRTHTHTHNSINSTPRPRASRSHTALPGSNSGQTPVTRPSQSYSSVQDLLKLA